MQKSDLISEITAYLSGGGLFYPELANHVAVRDLLIKCREALANVATNDTSKERVDEIQKQRHEQEPVAWPHKYGCRANAFGKCDMGCTTPPQRTWVGLTNEEREAIANATIRLHGQEWAYATAIEARLKELNT